MSEDATCHYCGPTDREMRPYGPGGTWVCHPCATASPERRAQTEAAFGALLDANSQIGTGIAAIGGVDGPRPFHPSEAIDDECFSCGEGDPQGECPASSRACGHHCNHIWTHDDCHWCGYEEARPDGQS